MSPNKVYTKTMVSGKALFTPCGELVAEKVDKADSLGAIHKKPAASAIHKKPSAIRKKPSAIDNAIKYAKKKKMKEKDAKRYDKKKKSQCKLKAKHRKDAKLKANVRKRRNVIARSRQAAKKGVAYTPRSAEFLQVAENARAAQMLAKVMHSYGRSH